jgi:hypothetical protein
MNMVEPPGSVKRLALLLWRAYLEELREWNRLINMSKGRMNGGVVQPLADLTDPWELLDSYAPLLKS